MPSLRAGMCFWWHRLAPASPCAFKSHSGKYFGETLLPDVLGL